MTTRRNLAGTIVLAAALAGCSMTADTKNADTLSRIKPATATETKCSAEELSAKCIEAHATMGYCIRWGLAGCGEKSIWKLEEDEVWVNEKTGTKVIPPADAERAKKEAEREKLAQEEAEKEAAEEAAEEAKEEAAEKAAAEEKAAQKAAEKEKKAAEKEKKAEKAPENDVDGGPSESSSDGVPAMDEEIPEPVPVEL